MIGVFHFLPLCAFQIYTLKKEGEKEKRETTRYPCIFVCLCLHVMYKFNSAGFQVALWCSVFRGGLAESPLTPFMWLTISTESLISSLFTAQFHSQTDANSILRVNLHLCVIRCSFCAVFFIYSLTAEWR